MKSAMFRCFLLSFFLINCAACVQKPQAVDIFGHPIQLTKFRGKWLVINYWAQWCPPCLTELPQLNAFSQEHGNVAVVLGVNFDHLPAETIQKFVQPLQLSFLLLSDFPLKVKVLVNAGLNLPANA